MFFFSTDSVSRVLLRYDLRASRNAGAYSGRKDGQCEGDGEQR